MNPRLMSFFLFLVGLLAHLRVRLIGMIGISEILICLVAPVLFVKNIWYLKRDGFMPMVGIMFMTCIGCLFASWYNHTPFENIIRGFATPVVLMCSFIFFHHALRNNFKDLKWLIAGLALTLPLSLLINGVSVEDVIAGNASNEIGDSGYLLTVLVTPLITLPVILFYNRMPVSVSAFILFAGGVFKIVTSESGRSAALGLFAAAVLVCFGGKSMRKMAGVKKHFFTFLVIGFIGIFAAKELYSMVASRGLLGEAAAVKYERQTVRGGGILSLLMGGRSEVFICIYAALDQPIVGFGPWAIDWKGYSEEFRQKYGLWDYEDDTDFNVQNCSPQKLFDCYLAGVPYLASDRPLIRKVLSGYPDAGRICDFTDANCISRVINSSLRKDFQVSAKMHDLHKTMFNYEFILPGIVEFLSL